MKKIILTILISLFTAVIADANEYNRTEDITSITKEQLGEYIGIDKNDTVKLIRLYDTYNTFYNGIMTAKCIESYDLRIRTVFDNIDFVLKSTNKQLNKRQYRKFLIGVNLILNDAGFSNEISLYCDKSK